MLPSQPQNVPIASRVRALQSQGSVAGESPATWLVAATLVGLLCAIKHWTQVDPNLRLSTRLLVQGYGLGFFLLLGLVVAGLCWVNRQAYRRWPMTGRFLPNALGFALAGALVGAAVLPLDLGNFIVRERWHIKPEVLGALIGAVGFVLARIVSPWLRGRTLRVLSLFCGMSVAYLNADYLVADYRGVHFFAGLFALFACGKGLALTSLGQKARYLNAMAAIAAGLAVLVPPRDSVRKGLWASSGSFVFPLVSSWAAVPRHAVARTHPVEASRWFKARTSHPEIAPHKSRIVPASPIVLLLTIDALRADVIEREDLPRRLPTLAKLREQSVWFRRARTPSPATVVTVTSLLTGKYYSQVYFKTIAPGAVEATHDRSVRVPEVLERGGIETSFVVAYRSLAAKYGVGRGFSNEYKTKSNYGDAKEVMSHVIAQLEKARISSGASQFVFAHFVDPHFPYGRGGKSKSPYEGYLADVALVDQELSRLMEYLETSGQSQRVILMVGADHGEAFGEHGMRFHGKNVYEELIRVPLLIHGPNIRPAHVDQPVTLLDLSSTILDLFGLPIPGTFMGQSLVPLLEGETHTLDRMIAVDAGRRVQAFYFDDGIKVIFDLPSRTVEVYDLAADPEELRDLVDDPSRDLSGHIAAAERFFAVHVLKVPGWQPPWRRS